MVAEQKLLEMAPKCFQDYENVQETFFWCLAFQGGNALEMPKQHHFGVSMYQSLAEVHSSYNVLV